MARLLPMSSKLGFGVGQSAEGIMFAIVGGLAMFYFNAGTSAAGAAATTASQSGVG